MPSIDQIKDVLSKKLPLKVVDYCVELWAKEPFYFKITVARKSKLGDFRYREDRKVQVITINSDLNSYQFLLTYIHEVAHLHAFIRYGPRIQAHGIEWKSTFQQLMQPVLSDKYLPIDLLIPLRKHMINPKASSSTDLFLAKELSKYDLQEGEKLFFLSDVRPGEIFELKGRRFEKGETRRTRVLCREVSSGKKYLIAQLAKVKMIS